MSGTSSSLDLPSVDTSLNSHQLDDFFKILEANSNGDYSGQMKDIFGNNALGSIAGKTLNGVANSGSPVKSAIKNYVVSSALKALL